MKPPDQADRSRMRHGPYEGGLIRGQPSSQIVQNTAAGSTGSVRYCPYRRRGTRWCDLQPSDQDDEGWIDQVTPAAQAFTDALDLMLLRNRII